MKNVEIYSLAWADQDPSRPNLYFWRTRGRVEVDFVVYGENQFTAIEVKNNATIRPQDLRSLKEFKKDYPQATTILIYRGDKITKIDDILCVPAKDYLEANRFQFK